MSIIIRTRNFPITQMRFNYSVLHEVLISLHVLDDYRRYPLHIHWALKTLRKLPPALNQERDYFRVLIRVLIFSLWDANTRINSTFADELQSFAGQPLEAFTTPIVSRFLLEQEPKQKTIVDTQITLEALRETLELQDQARIWLTKHFPDNVGLLDDLLTQPEQVKARFVDMLQAYWVAVFQEFWTLYEPHFLSDIEEKGKHLIKDGVLSVLKMTSPKMSINTTFHFANYVSTGADDDFKLLENDTLTLHPSYFTYPMLVFTVYSDEANHTDLSITYPMEAVYEVSTSPVLQEELLQILDAISDPTRLQILRLVAQVPRATREIAQILNLTESAISKHLKLLKAGGWVTSKRDSYFVLYRATSNPLPMLNRGLEDILKQ